MLIERADGLEIRIVLYIEHGEICDLLRRKPLPFVQGHEPPISFRNARRAVIFVLFADDEIHGGAVFRHMGDIAVPYRTDVQDCREQIGAAVHDEGQRFPAARITVGVHLAFIDVVISDKIFGEGNCLIRRPPAPVVQLRRHDDHLIVIAQRFKRELLRAQIRPRAEAVQPLIAGQGYIQRIRLVSAVAFGDVQIEMNVAVFRRMVDVIQKKAAVELRARSDVAVRCGRLRDGRRQRRQPIRPRRTGRGRPAAGGKEGEGTGEKAGGRYDFPKRFSLDSAAHSPIFSALCKKAPKSSS